MFIEHYTVGDFHPALLHFPIVLFFTALIFDLLYLIGKTKVNIGHWIIIWAFVFAIPTVITGWYTAESHGEWNDPYVVTHRNLALSTLAYALFHATFRIYVMMKQKQCAAYVFLILTLINIGLIVPTAEYGGIITRGRGIILQRPDDENHHDHHQSRVGT